MLFKMTNKGTRESGCEMPNKGQNKFIRNPPSIKKAILKPTENRNVSNLLSSYTLNIFTITNPGTNVR